MTQTYKALVGTRQDGKLSVGFAQLDAADIGDGDVEVAVEYSTLNYKDGLAISDAIPIVQQERLILGIDMAGTVVSSDSSRFAVGDRVVMNGYGASETHNGGYTERLRTNADYLSKTPRRHNNSSGDGDWHRRHHRHALGYAFRKIRRCA